MKREQKSLTNKGFSLVELIIVVAIMAVLVGVLAPQYLRYVEKARLQRDNSAIAEVANSIKIASAEELVYQEIAASSAVVEVSFAPKSGGKIPTYEASNSTELGKELKKILPEEIELTSGTYSGDTVKLKINVTVDGIVEIEAEGYKSDPNADKADDTQPKF